MTIKALVIWLCGWAALMGIAIYIWHAVDLKMQRRRRLREYNETVSRR